MIKYLFFQIFFNIKNVNMYVKQSFLFDENNFYIDIHGSHFATIS